MPQNLGKTPSPTLNFLGWYAYVSAFSIFSICDLKSVCHQIPIQDNDKQFTASEASGKLYKFNRIPFGITYEFPQFQRKIAS